MIVKAVVVDIGEFAEAKQIPTSSAFLKAELGAQTYEMIYPFENKKIAVIRNEHASVEGQQFNRAIYESDGETVKDIIQGKFIIVSTDENNLRSLTDEEAQKYLDLFHFPEKFLFDGEVVAFKYDPNDKKDSAKTKLIGDIWDGKYSPQKIKPSEEYENKRQRMNDPMQEMLDLLPESIHDTFDKLLEEMSALFSFEKRAAFQSGVDFGRKMFDGTQ